MLVEDPAVAVAEEVELQALQLQAGRLWDIADDDRAEVGLTRLGTDGGELRAGDLDLVVSARKLVGEGFDRGSHLVSLAKRAGARPDAGPGHASPRRDGAEPSQPNRRSLRGAGPLRPGFARDLGPRRDRGRNPALILFHRPDGSEALMRRFSMSAPAQVVGARDPGPA